MKEIALPPAQVNRLHSPGLPPFFPRIEKSRLDRRLILKPEEPLQPLGLTVEELPDPVGQGIEPEVEDTEDPLGGPEHMPGQDPELHAEAQVDRGEVDRCRH